MRLQLFKTDCPINVYRMRHPILLHIKVCFFLKLQPTNLTLLWELAQIDFIHVKFSER